MEEKKSAFSGGTKVTFGTNGTYSSGPKTQVNNNNSTKFINDKKSKFSKLDNNKKTFIYGFLGALVACVLVLLLFGLFGGLGKNVTLGSSGNVTINNADESETLAEAVANKCLPSVVAVNVYTNQRGTSTLSSLGSGVILTSDGYVITNQHVIDGASEIKVTANGQQYDADKIGEDSSSDIAVVKLKNASDLTAIELADSDQVKVGA